MKTSYIITLTLGILLFINACVSTHPKISSSKKTKIDYAQYLPKKSMIKRYTNQSGVKIERDRNKLVYTYNLIDASEGDISYTKEYTIDKDYIFQYMNTFKDKQIKREVSIGDITLKNIDNKNIEESCVLKNILTKFSHDGHSYKGDIIHERCKLIYLSKKAIDIYDKYSQKGLGIIAILNDSCYKDSNKYPTDTKECKSNKHNYRYYVK
ncbi:hypothetical protein MNB_SV-14-1684 [hydrothermal vent metagenome]|uniref:Uncharacterized protein n=1 Tax=hydrothermal vent metagenome TaxID=652676 RepID=A0A1W1C6T1_9ZZZZ